MMAASRGVKTEFLAVAASSKKSVTSILPSLAFLVARWIVFSTASNSRMTVGQYRFLYVTPAQEARETGRTVVKGKDFRVRDPLAGRHERQGGQTFNDRVAELVTRDFNHDLLKLEGRDESVVVGIKVPEGLSDTFSPKALEKLGKFLEADDMVAPAFTQVQPNPVAVKVEC